MSIAHWLRFALLLCFAGCSGSISPHATVGEFSVMGVNVPEGGVWQINRPIRLEFNHALDPSSVSFSSVLFLPVSPELGGNPVTGTFMIEAGSAGRVLKFQPYCPQEADWSDAGLVPGGYFYRLELPTSSTHAGTVLRDTDGRQLSNGISRNFRTPDPPTESIFLDENPLPPSVTSVSWPAGLNFFSRPDGPVSIAFDQSIDPSPANLNGDRITVHYSEETIASGLLPTFAHPVPGSFVMAANCTGVGALVEFHPHGLLPPDRWLRLTVSNSFRDISGQENFETWNSSLHATPTLEEFYGDQRLGYDSSNETWDEINEGFLDSGVLDPHAAIPGPPAGTVGGSLVATFDYPGQYVSEEMDFYWVDQGEIRTNGRTTISDSLNRVFVVDNGVLHVDDFHLGVDSFLRGVGTNPLIIYAQGTVTIDGELDASGQHSIHPTGLNSPQFPEGPMLGQCGGGDGGMSSQLTATETPRAGSGRGAFDTPVGGGQGGEGGFQQEQGVGGLGSSIPRLLAAGGGGGTFAMTPNYALWHKGWEFELSPEGADNNGPDHIQEKNPYWPDGVFRDHLVTTEFDLPIFGGEDGMRGSSVDAFAGYDPFNPPSTPHGTYGMEDERVDVVDPIDDLNNFDPRWDTPLSPVAVGHPTEGPDEGRGGLPVFTQDLDSSDDFWGRRLNQDGSVTTGELLAPWAGSGGGGSGDSQLVLRSIDPATGQYYPLIEEFPVRPFPPSSGTYRKGAPGGGGGGQILIMAIGPIRLGADSLLRVNGGIGRGGEGTIGTTGQISGAGGGSGGHLVLHSASGIDFSAIDVGVAQTANDIPNLSPAQNLRAYGGRRGCAGSQLTEVWGTNQPDGNGDLMIGRGGAGGNGIIQIHVPNPATDIGWPTDARAGIRDYLHDGDFPNGIFDVDRLDEMLDLLAAPKPYALLPIFSARSLAQSHWTDTGLAGIRMPTLGVGPWPDWASSELMAEGTDVDGWVETIGTQVLPLAPLTSGNSSEIVLGVEEATILQATSIFSGLEAYLRSPELLLGYDLLPDETAQLATFEIVSADFDPVTDQLHLTTNSRDGAVLGAANPLEDWLLRPKFFRVDTKGNKDSLPPTAKVRIQYQGTNDPEDGSSILPAEGQWTADLSLLKGSRFIRWRVEFDIDALNQGVELTNPRPALDYLKIPFAW